MFNGHQNKYEQGVRPYRVGILGKGDEEDGLQGHLDYLDNGVC